MTRTSTTLPAPRNVPLRGGPVLRWGIVAPGGIANDFVQALRDHTEQQIVAVASRSKERAAAFAHLHAIPVAYGAYAELLGDPTVQIVYVAAPHSEHLPLALAAIAAGKHVLVEKPIGVSAHEARAIRDAANAAGVFVMEAMWTRFLPQADVMVQLRDAGELGDIRMLCADFGFSVPRGGRIFDPAVGGGALLDLGVYPIWLSHLWLGAPERVDATGNVGPTGVDEQSVTVLTHPGGAQSVLTTGLCAPTPGRASVSGTSAHLDLDPGWVFPGGFSLVRGAATARFDDVSGLRRRRGMAWQAVAVAAHIDAGRTEAAEHPLQTSIEIMTVIDEARRQLFSAAR